MTSGKYKITSVVGAIFKAVDILILAMILYRLFIDFADYRCIDYASQ